MSAVGNPEGKAAKSTVDGGYIVRSFGLSVKSDLFALVGHCNGGIGLLCHAAKVLSNVLSRLCIACVVKVEPVIVVIGCPIITIGGGKGVHVDYVKTEVGRNRLLDSNNFVNVVVPNVMGSGRGHYDNL